MTIMRRSLRKSLVASHQTCPATAANAPSSHLEPQTRFSFFAYFPIERYKIGGEKTKQSILLPPFYSMYTIYQSIYTEYRVYWHIRLIVEQRLQAGRIRRTGEKKHIILQVQYASHYIPHSIVSRSCMLTEYHLAKFAELLVYHIQDESLDEANWIIYVCCAADKR